MPKFLFVVLLIFSLSVAGICLAAPFSDDGSGKSLEQMAAQGDAKAQFELGNMYVNGRGVPQD